MAADLSFLFNQTQPAGAMAGYQQGITNAKSLMDLEKMRSDMNTSEFNLDAAQQKLPLDIARMQSENAIKAHEASPDMLAIDKRQKDASAGITETQYREAIQKLTTNDIAQTKNQMKEMLTTGISMGEAGKSGAQALEYITEMLIQKHSNAKTKEERDFYNQQLQQLNSDPRIREMETWTPQQLVEQSKLSLYHMSQMSDDYILQELKNAGQANVARIGADASVKAAGIRAESGGGTDKQSLEQRLSTTLQNISDLYSKMNKMESGSPELNSAMDTLIQLTSLRNNLEKTLLGTKSVTQSQSVGGQTFTTEKKAGNPSGRQAPAPAGWVRGADGILRKQ